MNLDGKQVLVLGLAREGVSLARYLRLHGATVTAADNADRETLQARLTGLEESGVRLAVGGNRPELLVGMDTVFVSPGVPEDNRVYTEARRLGIPVQSMTTLFFDLCPGPIVGITGSSGKTTTTGLIGHMAREAGLDVVVGGNIGEPMIDLLPAIGPETTVVLELSSFQLSLMRRSPHVAVVTNISPNHLDRHGTMEEYIDAKRQIVAHQSPADFAVLNSFDPEAETFARSTPAQLRWFGERSTMGARVLRGAIALVDPGDHIPVLPVEEIPLRGKHNVENVLAAVTTGQAIGIPAESMGPAIRSFRPAAHRLQTVAEIGGVSYVDDSIATTPARARVALEAIETSVLLIAGGRDKRLPWEEFAEAVVDRVRVLLLIGEAAGQIEEAVRLAMERAGGELRASDIRRCDSLEEAVEMAGALAHSGDTVLLSPACTSYDMFSNYEERGRAFARAAEGLNAA